MTLKLQFKISTDHYTNKNAFLPSLNHLMPHSYRGIINIINLK